MKFKPWFELSILVFIEYRGFHEGLILVYFLHARMTSGQIKHASCLISEEAVNLNSILFHSINYLVVDYKLNIGVILATTETNKNSIHCNVIFTSAHDHIHKIFNGHILTSEVGITYCLIILIVWYRFVINLKKPIGLRCKYFDYWECCKQANNCDKYKWKETGARRWVILLILA